MDKSMKFKISRRNFLKMAGVATTGIMLSNIPNK
ncbi:MAG: twin-arginine translocation signal domain-containing protein, partial [Anaerovibrio sp.]|nr:twin-arginine translocation signal domain-containing protein [Anaerovibrio sp.]